MSKRLLILGTQFEFTELVKKSVSRGYYTVVCDGYSDGPARAFADKAYTIPVIQIDQIVKLCKAERIDHIITSFSDIMFECMVRIAEKAGLPCYVREDQLDAYRSKAVTKQICEELGIRVPSFCVLRSPEDLREAQKAGKIRYPAMVKPIDSYGSRGLSIVHCEEEACRELEDAIGFSFSKAAMIESISQGQELNCMAFLVDGKVYLMSIADRMTQSYDDRRIPLNYAIRYPSRYFDEVAQMVTDIFDRFARHTGQTQGPMAMQCFYDGEGIEVCEIAGRMFGFEHEMVTLTTGLDVEELLLDLEYDPQKAAQRMLGHDPKGTRHASCVYFQNIRSGIVGNQDEIRSLAGHPAAVQSVLFYKDGEQAGVLGPRQYFARFYVCADSREEMLQAEKDMFDHANVTNEKGERMIFVPAGEHGQA